MRHWQKGAVIRGFWNEVRGPGDIQSDPCPATPSHNRNEIPAWCVTIRLRLESGYKGRIEYGDAGPPRNPIVPCIICCCSHPPRKDNTPGIGDGREPGSAQNEGRS